MAGFTRLWLFQFMFLVFFCLKLFIVKPLLRISKMGIRMRLDNISGHFSLCFICFFFFLRFGQLRFIISFRGLLKRGFFSLLLSLLFWRHNILFKLYENIFSLNDASFDFAQFNQWISSFLSYHLFTIHLPLQFSEAGTAFFEKPTTDD